VFFFDEEETGLKGSTAYVKQRGVKDMVGLINLEMVGVGDKFALWPVNDNSNGKILESFEMASRRSKIVTKRFDQIVTNTADHVSFQKAGLEAFTITCISDGDIETAYHYDKALSFDVDMETLREILSTAPIFEHYHRSTDTYDRINEESILMTSSIIWSTILTVQK
jgi:Zn-dependent M28 family amino/carboxypeptidase